MKVLLNMNSGRYLVYSYVSAFLVFAIHKKELIHWHCSTHNRAPKWTFLDRGILVVFPFLKISQRFIATISCVQVALTMNN